ncbi:type II toxin-antitoxin system VapC family toxin [Argonema galeatum]|uniref:type II toxin-antitoxin system VapC family toxin n=1 Tax=Argonema galeatum TaxID=2942762 RepID=UPI002013A962|nr:type II toxin-antitoxin system VapC family toxin [Argonema galeatum]MCL1462865.1 type II toxin-antitoxin system VapC family toxin [Argonema galeatum A003/A1]
MANYVVDTSVVSQYSITQTYTPQARVLVARMYEGDELYVPEFCLLECANVLWKEVRFRGLSQTNAEQIIAELLALPFQMVSVSLLLPRALQIGLTHQLAVYDSLYIALALDRGFPLITVDDKQLNAATACGVVIKPINDFSPL